MKNWLVVLLIGAMMLQPGITRGDSDFSSDDFDLDVPDAELNIDVTSTPPLIYRDWDLYGFFKAETGISIAKEDGSPALAKLRGTLNLTFDYKINSFWKIKLNSGSFYDLAYDLNGRERYTQETLDSSMWEAELRDTYIEGDLGSGLSLKAGRQIIAWGESDSLQINDMANPRDNREIGMVELEDARIPVTASLISWSKNDWRLDFAAIHEYRANKLAPEGSEFDPLTTMRSNGIKVNKEELPAGGGEWSGRVQKSYNGGDVGFYASETYNDAFYTDFDSLVVVNGKPLLSLTPKHQKIRSSGFSANKVAGSLLIKAEVAYKEGLIFQRSDLNAQIQKALVSRSLTISPWIQKDQIQYLLGLEYMGLSDFVFAFEASQGHIFDWEETLAFSENTLFTFTSITHRTLNDTLSNRVVWVHYGDYQGDVYRWTVQYDVMDGLSVTGGVVLYESPKTDALLEPFKNNDRLTVSSRYSF